MMGLDFNNPEGFHAWIQGILFMLFFYHLLLFLQNKNRIYLFYSLFVVCLLIYFMHYIPNLFYLPAELKRVPTIFFGIQFLAYFFYISYIREVVETRKTLPKWDKVLHFSSGVLLLITLIIAVLDLFLSNSQIFTFVLYLFLAIEIFAVINYVIFYRIKTTPIFLMIIGSIIYITLANISLYHSILMEQKIALEYSFDPIIYMEIGTVIEALIFALVIGYKIKEAENEKKQTQVQLLKKSIEASEMKMTALKAQMNPHFIFNALNSINNFIISNNRKEASEYLTQFAKLTRSVLNQSEVNTITLREELQSLEQYICLEKLRIKDGFDYHLTITNGIDPEKIEVPPLFLQPYIENAIWHGLSPKNGYKLLSLDIDLPDNLLIIKIKDNGIGRKKKRCNFLHNQTRSFGSQITEERIKMMYPKAFISIKDVSCSILHKAIGTEVSIYFPEIIFKT